MERLLWLRTDDTNDTDSSFDRNRYYTKEFAIMARTAVAIGLMDNEERKFEPQFKPAVQTGLPAAYLKEDAPKIKAAFTQPGIYEVRLGSGKWMRFENTLKNGDVNVMSQPAGTLNSIMFNDDGERVDDAKDLMSKNIIVADIGFGTFDPYGIINRKKALEESINNLGMKRVLEVASGYIYKDYHMDIRIPQMRKYMKEGFFKVIDIQNMSSKKVPLDGYIEKACKEVAEMSIKKLYEVSGYFADYDLLVVTGGTGAAWIKYFEEILSGMEGLEIIPGNHGNNLPTQAIITQLVGSGYGISITNHLEKSQLDVGMNEGTAISQGKLVYTKESIEAFLDIVTAGTSSLKTFGVTLARIGLIWNSMSLCEEITGAK